MRFWILYGLLSLVVFAGACAHKPKEYTFDQAKCHAYPKRNDKGQFSGGYIVTCEE